MYQPVIPLPGNVGWHFLQDTYSRQLESFSNSSEIKNDREYMQKKLSGSITLDDFLADKRLLRITLTSFGLEGEEWKGGFIRKAIEEASDPESTFLTRLNNPKYTKFSETFAPIEGKIIITSTELSEMAANFESAAFESAVGDVDENMRLALNFQSQISEVATDGSSDKTILYRLLGDVPMTTLLQSALNLPAEMSSLDLDRQADVLKERMTSVLGINNMAELKSPEIVEKVIERFHVMETISNGASSYSPASAALTLLSNGIGSQASQNLFLSLL